ncbi:S9 family peptidase [Flavobacterium sp. LC2016-12]|uniref:alpha/beta hydrolase family protein n=1 Tax=Flavobacterium sp. LC2016-12 TaxID=2783794 RepID=UPI00188CFB6F|nr:alpha/beta hydrolase [Flavobacterium sp. LC2016-12]MBF4467315.1 alpha/beta hydrolase [Flavobacterium sp. LC2016-12]
MKKVILIIITILTSSFAIGQEISGQWNGLLKVPGAQLRIVANISRTETGYVSTMDSPDQKVKGIPVATTTFENSILKLEIPAINGSYTGILNKDNIIVGKLTQNGQSFDLNLSKESISEQVYARPQEPKKPYPYYTEDVKFVNKTANITLAGTLSLPKKEGNFPAVILITGSSAQNRDEEVLGHKPFLVISDYLTKKGIAVLRLDDRGVGESTGNFSTSTTVDFASDIQAGLDYLKTRNEINKKKLGLIGHSEGGLIAPMVAGNSKDISFIVLLAGPGLRGDKILLLQNELIKRQSGMPEVEIQKEKEIFKGAYDLIIASNVNDGSLKNNISSYLKTQYNDSSKDADVELLTAQVTNTWWYNFIKLDPVPFLKKVKCPVLALNGSKDLQVPAEVNLEAIKKTLLDSGNKKVTTKVLPNLNHLFQECQTGLPTEYKTIEQTFSPIALEEISSWLLIQTK